jgi:hypothetical protein
MSKNHGAPASKKEGLLMEQDLLQYLPKFRVFVGGGGQLGPTVPTVLHHIYDRKD